MTIKPPPKTEQELLRRCEDIAGKTLAELARTTDQAIYNKKGFVGQLIEWHLGTSAGNLSMPDFIEIGVELKTLPINKYGQPQESTYVCTASFSHETVHGATPGPMRDDDDYDDDGGRKTRQAEWQTSRVYQKLRRVLWVPVEADREIPWNERRVGNAILWSPDEATEKILREDWEELTEMLIFGQVEKLTAHFGTYLQIRPKAAHSRIFQSTMNEEGNAILAGPKGFYLRTILTKKILEENYQLIHSQNNFNYPG